MTDMRDLLSRFSAWREENACRSCGNRPDQDGTIEHGRGCYVADGDGGGTTTIGLPDFFAPIPAPTIQVNTDPTLSEVEFLRSVVRQIEHIYKCARDDAGASDFGLALADALDKIKGVCQAATARPSADDDIIKRLRIRIGDLESTALETSLLIKRLGIARSTIADLEQHNQILTEELKETYRRLVELRKTMIATDPRD